MYLVKKTLLIISIIGALILPANATEPKETIAGFDKITLLELLKILNVNHSYNLSSIVTATQKAWLRTGERWETEDLFEGKKEELLPYLEKLNLINPWLPQKTTYDGILFLGSANLSVENKTDFLIKQFLHGLKPNNLILLTGQRYLTDNEKNMLIQQGADKETMNTETDMMQFIINKKLSAAGFSIPITIIDTPGKTTPQGKHLRPTTLDTVIEWLKTNPAAGNYLTISFQPHCHYQLTILESILPKNITVEIIGDKCETTRIAIFLDAITRTLYAYQAGLK